MAAEKYLGNDTAGDPDKGTRKVPSRRQRAGLSNPFTPETAPLAGMAEAMRILGGH